MRSLTLASYENAIAYYRFSVCHTPKAFVTNIKAVVTNIKTFYR
ncbi:hypothetical protein [Fischerella sp. PCC 9605]